MAFARIIVYGEDLASNYIIKRITHTTNTHFVTSLHSTTCTDKKERFAIILRVCMKWISDSSYFGHVYVVNERLYTYRPLIKHTCPK